MDVTNPVSGSWTTGSYAGLWIFESVAGASPVMSDIRIEDNLVGWANPDHTKPYASCLDWWTDSLDGIGNDARFRSIDQSVFK